MTAIDELMDRFALARSWIWHHKPTGVRYRLYREDGVPQEGWDRAFDDLVGAADASLSDDWIGFGTTDDAVHRPSPEPVALHLRDPLKRAAAMEARLRAAGVEGADEVHRTLPGWLTPMEMAVAGIVERIALQDGEATVVIQQIKEKMGTLRVYIRSTPSDLAGDITTIARWAQACTVDRCAVTGRPGEIVGPGWLLTLSPIMAALREQDPERFDRALSTGSPMDLGDVEIRVEVEEAYEIVQDLLVAVKQGQGVVLSDEGRPIVRLVPV